MGKKKLLLPKPNKGEKLGTLPTIMTTSTLPHGFFHFKKAPKKFFVKMKVYHSVDFPELNQYFKASPTDHR